MISGGAAEGIGLGFVFNVTKRVMALTVKVVLPELFVADFNSRIGNFVGSLGRIFMCMTLLRTKINTTSLRGLCAPTKGGSQARVGGVLSTAGCCCGGINLLCLVVIVILTFMCPLVIRSVLGC